MKRKVHLAIPWLMAFILLIISVNSKAAQIHYFNFNENLPASNSNWAQPISANIGTGQLTYTFTQAYSFGGTTVNGNPGEVNGGSFVPRGGLEAINNGEHFILSVPTVGYESIVLTYASQRTATGFSTQTVHYTVNGTDWIQIAEFTEIPTSFGLFTVNFSSVTAANNNPNFAVKFVLTGATAEAGNNRFDNISVNGTRLPFDVLFQFNAAAANLPTWFGANRGIASSGNNIYVAKQSPVSIFVLNRLTGAETGTLNTTGMAGGQWAINDIEVSDDGFIFAANAVINNTQGNFKVYQVSPDPLVAPTLVIDFDVASYSAIRIGDKITVVGSVADGTAALYAGDGSADRIFKWLATGADNGTVTFGAPEIIPVTPRGASNAVAPLPNGNFYYTGAGTSVNKYSATGTLLGSIPGGIVPTGTTGMKYIGKQGNDEILAIYHYGAADGYLRVVRIPYGVPANAVLEFRTPVLGPTNSTGNGDVAFEPNADGVNVDLYVIDTSDGFGAYKSNNLNLQFPDYSQAGGPVFAFTPTFRNFGSVILGTTTTAQTFTISNTGTGTITIDPADITLSGPDAAEFVFTNIAETVVLGQNQSATFTVAFAPVSAGAKTATIEIDDNLGKGIHQIALSGIGVDPTLYPPFTQDFNTTTFPPEFWTRFSGLLQEQTTLTSTTSGWVHGRFAYIGMVNNSARLNVYGTTINRWLITPPIDLGDGSTDYELVFDVSLNKWNTANPPDMNGVDDKFAIVISTDGGLTWLAANTLRLYDNAGSSFVLNNISHTGETVVINLSAYSGVVKIGFYGESTVSNADNDIYVDNVTVQVVPETPIFSLNPATWAFGDVEVGLQSPARVFTISNAGPGTLIVNAPVLDNADDFILSYGAEDFPAELSGTETVTFSVVFEPETQGAAVGEITLGYNDGSANSATVALSGTGVVRPAGSTCGNPYVIASLPLVDFNGNTDIMGDDYSSTWITPNSFYLNGNDMVFQFTLDEPGYLSASMTSPGTWIGLFILQDCPDPVTPAPVIRSATSSGSAVSFANQYMEAGTYFAIVSSYPAPQTIAFTLNLSFNPGYTVTFVVEDEDAVAITDAIITLGGVTNPAGNYVFGAKLPGTFAYNVVKEGYFNATGEVIIVDADVTVTVVMEELPTTPVLVSITPVPNITVEYGTLEADAIAALAPTTTVTDSNSDTYTVALSWTIAGYDGDLAGAYTATGTFEMPEGVEQPEPPIALAVTAIVTVLEAPVVINTFPWLETFEQADFPPNGWARHNVDGGGTQWVLSTAQNHTPGGTRSAFHNYAAASAGNQNGWMVTPLLQLPNEDMRLIFWSFNSFPTFYGNNSVLVSTGSPDPASDDFVQVWTTATVAGSWVETIVDLSEFAGEEIYIAFRYQGLDAHGWYLDDVLVEATPALFTVTFHVAEDVTNGDPIEGAVISMTGYPNLTTDASGMATIDLINGSYTASVAMAGYVSEVVDFTVAGTDLNVEVALMDVIVNPFNLSVTTEGLEPGQALLKWNEAEGWANSFEGGTLPEGWTRVINNTGTQGGFPCTWTITGTVALTTPIVPQDGNYQAFMMWSYNHQDEWLITPEFTAPAGDLAFWYHGTNGSTNADNYYVKVSTDGGANWTILWNASTLPAGANPYQTPAVIDLSAFAGEDIHIAWNNVDGPGNDGLWFAWAIDNITVGGERIDVRDLMVAKGGDISTGVNLAARDGEFQPLINPADMISERNKAFVGYNIYLDNLTTPMANVTDTDYLFSGLAAGEYTAGVQSVYTTGLSEIVTIDFEVEGLQALARLQIIHNSADAAVEEVDIFVNGDLFLSDFAFRTATPFVDVPAGVDLNIIVAPAGAGIANGVGPVTVNLTEGETYIAIANGIVSATGYDPATAFSLDVFPTGREAATVATNTDVLVFHGSTDAPTVSVWETGVGAGELFTFSYGDFAGYLQLGTADYILEVRTADGETTVVAYSAPLATLGLDGAAITVVASGFLNPANNSAGPAFGLYVALASGGDLIALPVYTETFEVTFNVNMTYAEGFDPATDVVYLTGSIFGWAQPGTQPENQTMSRVGESMVWTKIVELEAGTYAYKYFLNAGWDGGEWQGGDDRVLVVEADMVVNDWFGSLTDPTTITDPSLAQIRIFPVPARTTLYISSPEVIRDLRIIDMLGQVAYSANVAGLSHEVNVGGFKDGIYFIQILTSKGIETRRIQVQK
jgi:hypothetical protein